MNALLDTLKGHVLKKIWTMDEINDNAVQLAVYWIDKYNCNSARTRNKEQTKSVELI